MLSLVPLYINLYAHLRLYLWDKIESLVFILWTFFATLSVLSYCGP